MSLGSSHVKLPIHPNMNGLDNAVIMEVLSWKRKFFFFFPIYYIQFTLFRTKNLHSPGTYISKRSWDPSQKATTK